MLIELIEDGAKDNDANAIRRLKNNKFCPSVKGKILYVYYPDKYLPIYSKKDLIQFIKALSINTKGIDFKKLDEFDLRNILIDWKNKSEQFRDKSMMDYMIFLYNNYKYNVIENELDDKLQNDINNEEIVDVNLSELNIEPIKKIETNKIDCYEFYPRSRKIAMCALARANYKCEYCNEHYCFTRKTNGKPYTEVHHLIPLAYHNDFLYSLDNIANIVSLCSNCHNEIHYGKDADKIIKKLYDDRKNDLIKANLPIKLNKLLEMYR